MAAESGQLELNAFEPILFYNIFESIETLGSAAKTFVENCIVDITANKERCKDLLESSVGIATALCPYIGYKKSASIAKESLKSGKTIKELVIKENLMTEEKLKEVLEPFKLTGMGEEKTRKAV